MDYKPHFGGLSTGFPNIDRITYGLEKSNLILLAAYHGMGKTSLALNITLNVAKSSNKTVAYFSLVEERERLATLLLCAEALVEKTRLETNNLRQVDEERIAMAIAFLNRLGIHINHKPIITIADIERECKMINNLGLVVVDYLQLISSADNEFSPSKKRSEVISDIMRMLKSMAKTLNVPVLCLSQLNRNNKKKGKRPTLCDLPDSDSLEEDSDIVILLYRDNYYIGLEDSCVTECIIAKNRHGQRGIARLRWIPEYVTFASLDRFEE